MKHRLITLCALVLVVIIPPRRTHAQASSLHITPAKPAAGQTVTVEYRASDRLADEHSLVLRARTHRSEGDPRNETLGTLRRVGERTYRGTFRISGDMVYCVLAVEDPEAEIVDDGGEAWEVVVHNEAGTPLLEGLNARYTELRMRNTQLAAQVADDMARLYPTSARPRFLQFVLATNGISAAARDSLAAVHRAQLATLLPALDSTDERTITDVVFYANTIGDTATHGEWQNRLLRLYPNGRAAKQQRVFLLNAKNGREAYWAALERLWQADQTQQNQLVFTAVRTAEAWKDAAQIERWAERGLAHDYFDRSMIISAFMSTPELRAQGLDHIRAYVKALESRSDDTRPITQSRAEYAATRRRWTANYFAQLGQALADAGQHTAALDTLSRAADFTWDPALFRTIARIRLSVGDTAGAIPLLARVAADATTHTSFVDSVRSQYSAHIDAAQWTRWLEQGREAMTKHVLLYAVDGAAVGSFRLTDDAQTVHRLSGAHEGMTVVAAFSRHCVPSLLQLKQLDALTKQLAERGVRVIAIAKDDDPRSQLRDFLDEQKLTFDYYYDMEGELTRALGLAGTPTYVVLDAQGRPRFESHSLENITRQLWLLQHAPARVSTR